MSAVEKLALVVYDPTCDCCCKKVHGVTTVEKAKKFVESKGQYSDWSYIEVEVGRILEDDIYC